MKVPALSAVLADRLVSAAAMVVIAVIAWLHLWSGAGLGMSAMAMTEVALFPHQHADMGAMDTSWIALTAMWCVMMVAMMTPAAAPLVLLHARVLAHRGQRSRAASLFLLAGYLAAWLLFSVVAAALEKAFEPVGLASGMMMWSRSALLSATVLALAGLYQLSPLKHACLSRCRAPVDFLMRYWRPGWRGAFLLGLRHGAFCVGCCWLLMALLFVFGVMNVAWIVLLTLLVLAEKLLPARWHVPRISGAILLAWAGATLVLAG